MVGNINTTQNAPSHGFLGPLYNVGKWVRYLPQFCAEEPTKTIQKIKDLASDGLEKAPIKSEKTSAQFQEVLTNELKKKEISAISPTQIESDRKLQKDRWHKEMNTNLDALTDKVSAFSALYIMRNCAEITTDKDTLPLMNLVKQATEGTNQKSLWALFTEHYKNQLTFFKRIKAGWYYLVYYKTSLINNVAKTYLRYFVDALTADLIDKDSGTRKMVFTKILENADRFLTEDLKAMKKFANQEECGILKDYRERAIDNYRGASITELSQKFAVRIFNKEPITVPLFQPFQQIPLIGWFFVKLQSWINDFVIQKVMKEDILPMAFQEVIETGLEKTSFIPFSNALTSFFIERLKTLQKQFKAESGLPIEVDALPRYGELPAVVKGLIAVLQLEETPDEDGLTKVLTAGELRAKIEIEDKKEINRSKWWWKLLRLSYLDQTVEGSIEKGIIEAGNLLFSHLNETAQSGELFAEVLKLAKEPFSGETISSKELEKEKKRLEKDLQEHIVNVSKTIIDDAVTKKLNADKALTDRSTAIASFDARQLIATKTVEALSQICEQMTAKINASVQDPLNSENSVHAEISSFFQIMKVFASQDQVKNKLDSLEGQDKNLIWELVTPIYQKAAIAEEDLLRLQNLQNEYPKSFAAEKQLLAIQATLKSIQNDPDFLKKTRHNFGPTIASLKACKAELKKHLGDDWEESAQLQEHISKIIKSCEHIEERQKVINAATTLTPVRLPGDRVVGEGLLDQLLMYQQGNAPRGFQPKLQLQKISQTLDLFPPKEKEQLKLLIGNGSTLVQNWEQIGKIMQTVYHNHRAYKEHNKLALVHLIPGISRWVGQKASVYRQKKEQVHSEMKEEVKKVSEKIDSLDKAVKSAKLYFPPAFTATVKKTIGAFAGASIAGVIAGGMGVLGNLLSPWAGPWATSIGVGVGTASYTASQNLKGLRDGKVGPWIKTAAASISGGTWIPSSVSTIAAPVSRVITPYIPSFVSNLFAKLPEVAVGATAPFIAPVVSGAMAGWNYDKAIHAYAQAHVVPEVTTLFFKAVALIKEPRVSQAAVGLALKELV